MSGTDIWTIQRLIRWTTDYFKKHGIEEARLDAELLLGHVLGKPRIYLYTNYDQIMNVEELAQYRELIRQRVQGYCTAVLIGEKEFMGLPFSVNDHVLVPRPDTEAWLEKIIQSFRSIPGAEMLDLGTGSGALAVSFLYYCREAHGMAVDISEEALQVARENAGKNGVEKRLDFYQGDFLHAVPDGAVFDVILSNPPYIPTADLAGLDREVRREPQIALDGGRDGLDFYRILGEQAVQYLKPGGLLAVEVGIHQAADVKALFEAGSLKDVYYIQDYGGIDRAVCGRKAAAPVVSE